MSRSNSINHVVTASVSDIDFYVCERSLLRCVIFSYCKQAHLFSTNFEACLSRCWSSEIVLIHCFCLVRHLCLEQWKYVNWNKCLLGVYVPWYVYSQGCHREFVHVKITTLVQIIGGWGRGHTSAECTYLSTLI